MRGLKQLLDNSPALLFVVSLAVAPTRVLADYAVCFDGSAYKEEVSPSDHSECCHLKRWCPRDDSPKGDLIWDGLYCATNPAKKPNCLSRPQKSGGPFLYIDGALLFAASPVYSHYIQEPDFSGTAMATIETPSKELVLFDDPQNFAFLAVPMTGSLYYLRKAPEIPSDSDPIDLTRYETSLYTDPQSHSLRWSTPSGSRPDPESLFHEKRVYRLVGDKTNCLIRSDNLLYMSGYGPYVINGIGCALLDIEFLKEHCSDDIGEETWSEWTSRITRQWLGRKRNYKVRLGWPWEIIRQEWCESSSPRNHASDADR